AGIPIARGFLSIGGLHPQRRATNLTWRDGAIKDVNDFPHETMATPLWRESPFRHMIETGTRRLHRRLTGDDAVLDYPVLREFRELGHTEWLALLHGFGARAASSQGGQLGAVLSWATASAGGWSGAQLAAIEELSGTLALAVKGSALPGVMRDLLAAYLGGDAADRVIAGQVQRGSVSRVAAAILYADLRGFTDFAEGTPPEEVTRRLNGVFDCLGEPVRAAGGEILKFLGDGALVVFLPKPGAELTTVAASALDAARDIMVRVAALNAAEVAAGHPPLVLDMALHAGDVTYGNIGTADRVDFTVIGPAVNEATRLESLCKELGEPLLISQSFVRAAPSLSNRLRSTGPHRLRGVREPQEVFALAERLN
ncbi:MAG TPA: adenylate/guanylate cyclase domain-containing protein, partial [Stellaceae bacterium]|nr:adenylate/guanylate cyclase domain-containing protein [Stellaceae bacterium]